LLINPQVPHRVNFLKSGNVDRVQQCFLILGFKENWASVIEQLSDVIIDDIVANTLTGPNSINTTGYVPPYQIV